MERSIAPAALDTERPKGAQVASERLADADVPADALPRLLSFLVQCGAPVLDPSGHGGLRVLGARLKPEAWRLLFSQARDQGMASLVFLHATQAGALASAPAEVAAGLAASYAHTLVTSRQLQLAQRELLTALGSRGIQAMVLKGTALAERYYGNVALRPVRDIDLLVWRADLPAAVETLKRLGYVPQRGLGRPTQFFALASAALGYQHAGRVTVEVHWQLTSRPVYRPALDVRRAWARALPLDTTDSGALALRLAPADELRFLCVHLAAEHEMSRLIWLVDIATLVRSLDDDWNWDAFSAETIAGGAATPVAVALRRAADLLDLDVPPASLQRMEEAARAPRELHAWQVARAAPFTGAWMWSRLAATKRPLDLAVLLRGMLVPRPSTLVSLGYRPAPVWRLPITYLRHWRCAAVAIQRARAAMAQAANSAGGQGEA